MSAVASLPPIEPVFIGSPDPAAEELLRDVVAGMCGGPGRTAPVVFAFADSRGVRVTVWEAKGRAHRAPIILVLPFEDEVLRDVAMRSGADGCYCLGSPNEELRLLLVDLVVLGIVRR